MHWSSAHVLSMRGEQASALHHVVIKVRHPQWPDSLTSCWLPAMRSIRCTKASSIIALTLDRRLQTGRQEWLASASRQLQPHGHLRLHPTHCRLPHLHHAIESFTESSVETPMCSMPCTVPGKPPSQSSCCRLRLALSSEPLAPATDVSDDRAIHGEGIGEMTGRGL